MSTKKEIWRLLEPGVDRWEDGDEVRVNGRFVALKTTPNIVGHCLLGLQEGRRRMTLPEPQGWISVEERMPTKEDANKEGSVFWRDLKNGVEEFVVRDWNTRRTLFATHWMRIPPVPLKVKDPHEELWKEAYKKLDPDEVWTQHAIGAAKSAFLEGRKSVLTEGGSHA